MPTIEAIQMGLRDVRGFLENEGSHKHAAQIGRGMEAIQHLQACLLDAADEMSKSTVFVTSRERIKRPEGVDLWLAAIEQARTDAREMSDGE